MPRKRADQVLVARGVAETRAKAQAAIAAGGVRADGVVVRKAADLIAEDAVLELDAPHPWVSRAGLKLDHGLSAFGVNPAGWVCLDLGASTGGFTDVLLARGAAKIYAVDVGRDQLHPKLRAEPRVVVLEGQDARDLSHREIADAPRLITADVSFIGLAKAAPAALKLATPAAVLIALIKPQFEAGPGKRGKSGLIEDVEARRIAEATVAAFDGLEGFVARELIASPIRGGAGQREFLMLARRG
jgi:23S rRNA (cytidine1920-2'-O)/16S rRNA (cytidine1409-2'-O)-methyltransferase